MNTLTIHKSKLATDLWFAEDKMYVRHDDGPRTWGSG
jgi:hypothetical protein